MIKSILFLSALLGVQTMPVYSDDQYVGQQERQYQHTEDIGGNTQVTYKYETNEVNSVDDLVIGNIYEVNCTGNDSIDYFCNASFVFGKTFSYGDYSLVVDMNTTSPDYIRISLSNETIYCYYRHNDQNVNTYSYANKSVVFVYQGGINSRYISYVSSTNYNEIVSVEYVPPTSLFGLMADFFDEYIYSGIPHINDINYEVNGQTITMKDWLVVSTTIAIVILFLFILFFIFRWLIRTFSNAFLWR